MFVDVGFAFYARHLRHFIFIVEGFFEEFGVCRKLRAEVEVVKKRIFFMANIDKGGIQAGHELFNLCQIDITHSIGRSAPLFLERHQTRVFGQSYGHILFLHVDNKFALHGDSG